MRDHFLDYPLGGNVLTILVIAVIVGAFFQGKSLPKSKLYAIWLVFGVYLYVSMWFGAALGNAPAPLWLTDQNFVTWKDYMLISLTFLATSLVVEDRKAVRTVILITAVSLFFIDRSCILESMSRTWATFDENKRDGGPLGYGSNQTAAYLAQFAMFFWGAGQFLKRRKIKILCYVLVGLTVFATMYTFSRGAYLAILFSVFVLGVLKDRKLLLIGAVFLLTWQAVVPTAVRQRVDLRNRICDVPVYAACGQSERYSQLVREGYGGNRHDWVDHRYLYVSADARRGIPYLQTSRGPSVSRSWTRPVSCHLLLHYR